MPTATDYGALSAFFAESEIKWKPQSVTKDKTRAMATVYIDARAVMDRLDEVVGPGNWQDHYRQIDNSKSVECSLSIRFCDEKGDCAWITKTDTGSESEQPEEGDRMKAAYSDALKRAAVKFGIGRYLYRFPQQWVAFDGRRFTETPKLPTWARPRPKPATKQAASATVPDPYATPEPAPEPLPAATPAPAPALALSTLQLRLYDKAGEKKVSLASVLKHYGVEKLSDLTDMACEEAIEKIQAK